MVADFVRGVSFKPDDVQPLGTKNTIACFRTKNVQEQIDLEDVWAIPKTCVSRDEQILEEGDLLVSTANSWNLVGKCCWVPRLGWPATLGGFIAALRPRLTEVSPRFLYHWFSWGPVQANLRSCARRTTNISNLDLNQALDLRIPLPPLEEQRRIAAILDKADELRQKRRSALQKLDSLTQSIFLDMFGGSLNTLHADIRLLGEVCTRITDGTHQPPSGRQPEYRSCS
jgi:type I restriction enzyme S subunit